MCSEMYSEMLAEDNTEVKSERQRVLLMEVHLLYKLEDNST